MAGVVVITRKLRMLRRSSQLLSVVLSVQRFSDTRNPGPSDVMCPLSLAHLERVGPISGTTQSTSTSMQQHAAAIVKGNKKKLFWYRFGIDHWLIV